MKNDCIFCAIADGEIPSFKVYEDNDVVAYLDINPCSKGHTLVIPKAHYPNLAGTGDEALATLIKRVKAVAVKVSEALEADGFNILQNNGQAAGQSVFHVHFHIVPRYKGEPALSFASQKADMSELAALAQRIASHNS